MQPEAVCMQRVFSIIYRVVASTVHHYHVVIINVHHNKSLTAMLMHLHISSVA